MRPNAEAIRAALGCSQLGCECQRPGGNVHCPVPGHGKGRGDEHPSLTAIERNGRVSVHCWAGCRPDVVITALRQRGLWPGKDNTRPEPLTVTRYELRDVDGSVVAVHVRRDRSKDLKTFSWERPDGSIGLGGLRTADVPLYGVHLLRKRPNEPVILVEGEKAAQALQHAGILAVGTVTGASTLPSAQVLHSLLGRDVTLWPDADEPGRVHMQRIAAQLQHLGMTPQWVEWRDSPLQGDAADFMDEHGAGIALDRLLAEARPVGGTQSRQGRAVLLRLSDVTPKPVRWLWRRRIPLGKVTVLDGDPGLAKSLLALELAARLTRGARMPDGTQCDVPGPCGVVLLTAEDDPEDTVRPRLDAAGADVKRIVLLTHVKDPQNERLPTIADLDALEAAIQEVDAKFVVVDPLIAFVPDTRDSHRDQDIRRALAPLAQLAARTGAAVLVIRHLNKSGGGNPLYRGGGSIGIIGAARSGLLVATDPDDLDGERRILAVTKANLSAPPPALAYRVEARDAVPRIVWEGQTTHSAATLLAAQIPEQERSALAGAEDFLREVLSAGPVSAAQVKSEARQAGVSERTLNRAKGSLKVMARKNGFKGGWTWALSERSAEAEDVVEESHVPSKDANLTEDGQISESGNLRHPWQPSVSRAPDGPCSACGHTQFWLSTFGKKVCATCHPPASLTLVQGWV